MHRHKEWMSIYKIVLQRQGFPLLIQLLTCNVLKINYYISRLCFVKADFFHLKLKKNYRNSIRLCFQTNNLILFTYLRTRFHSIQLKIILQYDLCPSRKSVFRLSVLTRQITMLFFSLSNSKSAHKDDIDISKSFVAK